MLTPTQFREEAPSFMDSWSCYSPQFTKPGSLTQLTLPSVPRGHYIHLYSKSTDGPQVPTQATSYKTFGTGGQWCPCSPPFLIGGSSLSPCLPAAGFKEHACIPTHPGESSLGKRDASSITIHSRCFLVYRLLSRESSCDSSLPSDTPTNRVTPNGDISHCAHPQIKKWRLIEGVIC